MTIGIPCDMLIPEVLNMNREELNKLLAQLHGELQELDLREPVDEASEEYDRWAEEHEEVILSRRAGYKDEESWH